MSDSDILGIGLPPPTPAALLKLARVNPTVHTVLAMTERGDIDSESALILCILALAEQVDKLTTQLIHERESRSFSWQKEGKHAQV